ncbi:MAG: hypothetical protein U1E32_05770, partial [Rhodoglobus sp.]|nr:hypothetical protein [Rhodoglobus sp.]
QWDAPTRVLSFAPAVPGPFRSLFTTGTGWGRVEIDDHALTVHVDGGVLDVGELQLSGETIGRDIRLRAGASHRSPLTPTPTPEES